MSKRKKLIQKLKTAILCWNGACLMNFDPDNDGNPRFQLTPFTINTVLWLINNCEGRDGVKIVFKLHTSTLLQTKIRDVEKFIKITKTQEYDFSSSRDDSIPHECPHHALAFERILKELGYRFSCYDDVSGSTVFVEFSRVNCREATNLTDLYTTSVFKYFIAL
ncbi:MAG: hypothetical protein AAB657_03440 [Patescibacteria group bacterium]